MDDNKAAPVFSHYSVLLYEAVDRLAIKPDGVYMDCTLGGGGHSLEILKRLGDRGRLIAVDQDAEAIAASKKRLADYLDKIDFIHDNFENAVMRAKEIGYDGIDGAVIDLGVSSYQLDTPERGFSYMKDAPLDMRMDPTALLTAKEVVNTYSEERLKKLIFDYGEERFAGRIASRICEARERRPLETTFHPGEEPRGRTAPGKAHVSGDTHRGELGARRDRADARFARRFSETGRKAVCDNLPFARGQDREADLREVHARMHLPAGFPGVCVREEAVAETCEQKTDTSVRERARREPALEKREIKSRRKARQGRKSDYTRLKKD